MERRKRPRGKTQAGRKSAASTRSSRAVSQATPRAQAHAPSHSATGHGAAHAHAHEDACYHCAKDLSGDERALFVEEEIGRIFCSEQCITGYFAPEIERLEKEYLRRVPTGDLTPEERESYSHLRWITLQEADEVWREKTLSGDYRYTLVSEFQPGHRRIWCVCICLFLRGEPSFLHIAFTTKSAALVGAYRRGERMQWDKEEAGSRPSKSKSGKSKSSKSKSAKGSSDAAEREIDLAQDEQDEEAASHSNADLGDRLADAWTEDETFLAKMNMERSPDDIPPEEFELFQSCLEETLETPDEVWSLEMTDPEGVHLYHFIREYPNERPGHWYVIVARETENEEQIEILDAFPTRDAHLVERYRRGTQEVGEASDSRPASRLVH